MSVAEKKTTTVRYEWLNEPGHQGGKDVVGWIDVQVEGVGVPAKDRISVDEILDWEITYDGKTISSPSSGGGVEMVNHNFGRNELFATSDGLFLIGEVGAHFRLINYHEGDPPFQPSTFIMKAGVHSRSGPTIAYKFSEFTPPWHGKDAFSAFYRNNQPMGFDGNAIQIGTNPKLLSVDGSDDGDAGVNRPAVQLADMIGQLQVIHRRVGRLLTKLGHQTT